MNRSDCYKKDDANAITERQYLVEADTTALRGAPDCAKKVITGNSSNMVTLSAIGIISALALLFA